MNDYDERFVDIFNTYYPFEKYIVKDPKPLGLLFSEDVLLTEIFVPHTKCNVITDDCGNCIGFHYIDFQKIYIKVKTSVGEICFGYADFREHIRENIRDIIISDIGDYEWECLYVDNEDSKEVLKPVFEEQYRLITEKYGSCYLKDSDEFKRL